MTSSVTGLLVWSRPCPRALPPVKFPPESIDLIRTGASPWAGGAPCEQAIRSGLTLAWGTELSSQRTLREDASTCFDFVIGSDSDRSDDRMTLARPYAPTDNDVHRRACVFHVTIALSDAVLRELLLDDKTPGAAQVRAVAANAVAPAVTLPLTPGARFAVESIRRCPFAGACRAMALTARCNDLLVEFLTALTAATVVAPRPSPLTRNLTAQIHTAAEFLAHHLEEPPALATLARHAGLSETTLKRGFRQVFGTTVFGYLRDRRMQCAHALLHSGEATVLEAAALVGYSNPSNFAAAFRRQFGLNPKAFQLTARR